MGRNYFILGLMGVVLGSVCPTYADYQAVEQRLLSGETLDTAELEGLSLGNVQNLLAMAPKRNAGNQLLLQQRLTFLQQQKATLSALSKKAKENKTILASELVNLPLSSLQTLSDIANMGTNGLNKRTLQQAIDKIQGADA